MTAFGDYDASDYGDHEPCVGCIRGEHEHCGACGESSHYLVKVTDVNSIPQTVMACPTCREDSR